MGRPEHHHGISTTAAGTLGSAELSIQQAIDSDRQRKGPTNPTFDGSFYAGLSHRGAKTNPAKHVPTTTKNPKNETPGD